MTQIQLVPLFQAQCVLWQFQYEQGESGTPHYQGFCSFKHKVRPLSTIKVPGIHWEKTRGSKEDNIAYTSKAEGRIAGPWGNLPKPKRDPMSGRALYPWQQQLLELLKTEPDDRTIHWYWEPHGRAGKTSFAKHIRMNYNALYVNGKGTDIKSAIATAIEKRGEIDIVIFNFVRSSEDYISYDSIESIKDGIMFSGKYESMDTFFNPPHIVCFANFPPQIQKLSEDRWHIVDLSPTPVFNL